MGRKEDAIRATNRFIMELDTELEMLEEHGGHSKRYAQLSRALMAAQKRKYRLTSAGHIVMAQVPSGAFGSLQIRYGKPADVMYVLEQARAVWGK